MFELINFEGIKKSNKTLKINRNKTQNFMNEMPFIINNYY
jgi:hypothetical protein